MFVLRSIVVFAINMHYIKSTELIKQVVGIRISLMDNFFTRYYFHFTTITTPRIFLKVIGLLWRWFQFFEDDIFFYIDEWKLRNEAKDVGEMYIVIIKGEMAWICLYSFISVFNLFVRRLCVLCLCVKCEWFFFYFC